MSPVKKFMPYLNGFFNLLSIGFTLSRRLDPVGKVERFGANYAREWQLLYGIAPLFMTYSSDDNYN